MVYADRSDCTIMLYPVDGVARLLDDEGRILWTFTLDTPDHMIWTALGFANLAFQQGYVIGCEAKAKEIRKVLQIKED